MSAFVVGDDHIGLLVSAAIHHHGQFGSERVTRMNAQAVGQALRRENEISVNYRYNQSDDDAQPFTWRDTLALAQVAALKHAQVLKAIDCYEYQSCEHPQWESSDAKRFCDYLRSAVIDALPGYDAAQWEFRLTA